MSSSNHILLVEDDENHVLLFKNQIKDLDVDFEVTVVKSKATFVEALERIDPDLIISDYQLPGFTGLEALQIAKESNPDIPLVLISAYLTESEAIEAMKEGAADYILKDNLKRLKPVITRELLNYSKYKQSQFQLKEKQQLLNKAYQLSGIGHWQFDPINEEVYWSDNIKLLHEVDNDYSPTIDEAFAFYKEGHSRDKIKNAVNEMIENGTSFELELKIITAKGNERWVRVIGEGEFRDKKCVRIYGSTQNIHQQKKTKKELKDTEQKLRDIIEHSTNMFYRHDPNHKLTYLSPQCKEFLGYDVDEAKQEWTNFITDHPVNEEGYKHTQKAIDSGEAQPHFELQLKKKDGEIIWVKVNEAPVLDEKGETEAIVGSLTDITARKKMEQELRLSEQRFKSLVQDGTDQIAVIDRDGFYQYIAPIQGYSNSEDLKLDEFVGENCFRFIHPEDRQRVKSIVQNLEPYQRVEIEPFRFLFHDESWRWLQTRAINLEDNPAVRGIVTTSRDISDRIEREKELKETLKEKETLLLEIHHRVKNNLAVVSGMMQLQAYEENNTELKEKLYDSMSRIQSMSSIHEILYQSRSFSQLSLGDNIKQLISNILKTYQESLELDLHYQLDDVKLNINQAIPLSLIINEVFTNILKHAYDLSDLCGVVSVCIQEHDEYVHLTIEDDGKGLDQDINDENLVNSLGINLIRALSTQLEARFNYSGTEKGTRFELSFKKSEARGSSNAIATA